MDRLAEGHIQRASHDREYGLRPKTLYFSTSWGVAPGYDDDGLRPKQSVSQIAQLQNLRVRLFVIQLLPWQMNGAVITTAG